MIPIVNEEEVITGRMRGTEKYATAIEKSLEWIKKSIESSKDGVIRMKITDLAKEMGSEFRNRTPMVIYRNLKTILFDKNIIVELGTHKDGDKLLTMKFATKIDKLRGPGMSIEEDDEVEKEKAEKDIDIISIE